MHRPRPAPAARAAAAALLLLLVQGATSTCIQRQRVIDLPLYAVGGEEEEGSLEQLWDSHAGAAPASQPEDEGPPCDRDCDFRLADDGPRRPVEVVRYGRPCVCKEPLPYHVEVPEPAHPVVRGEYGYEVHTLPEPAPVQLKNFEFDVERTPEPQPCRTRDYAFDVHRVPEPPPVRLQNFAFDVQRPVVHKAPCVTRDLPYSVHAPPAPPPVTLHNEEFDVERPVKHRQDRLCGLTAAVDRVVIPAHDCPDSDPDAPCDHVICSHHARYDSGHAPSASGPAHPRVQRSPHPEATPAPHRAHALRPSVAEGVTLRESFRDVVHAVRKSNRSSSSTSERQATVHTQREEETDDLEERKVERVDISENDGKTRVEEVETKDVVKITHKNDDMTVESSENDSIDTEVVDKTLSIRHSKIVDNESGSIVETVSEIIDTTVNKSLNNEGRGIVKEENVEREERYSQGEEEVHESDEAETITDSEVDSNKKNTDFIKNVDEASSSFVAANEDTIAKQLVNRNSQVVTMQDKVKRDNGAIGVVQEAHDAESRLHGIAQEDEGTFVVKENVGAREAPVEIVKFVGREASRSPTVLEAERLLDPDTDSPVNAEGQDSDDPREFALRKRSSAPGGDGGKDGGDNAQNEVGGPALEPYPAPAATEHGLEATPAGDKASYTPAGDQVVEGPDNNAIEGSDGSTKDEVVVHEVVKTEVAETIDTAGEGSSVASAVTTSDSGSYRPSSRSSGYKEQDATDGASSGSGSNTGYSHSETSASGYESNSGSTYQSGSPGTYTVTETTKTYTPTGGYTVTKETTVRSKSGYGEKPVDTQYGTSKGKPAYVVGSGAGYVESQAVSSDSKIITSYVAPVVSYQTDKGSYTITKVTEEPSAHFPSDYMSKEPQYIPPPPGPVPPKKPGYMLSPPGYVTISPEGPSTHEYLSVLPKSTGYVPSSPGYFPTPSKDSYLPSPPGYLPVPPTDSYLPSPPGYLPVPPTDSSYLPSPPGYLPVPPKDSSYFPPPPGYLPAQPQGSGYVLIPEFKDGKKGSYIVEKVTYGGDKSPQYGTYTSEYVKPSKKSSYGFKLASGYNILGEARTGVSKYEADLSKTNEVVGSYEEKSDYHGLPKASSYSSDLVVPIKDIIKDYEKEQETITHGTAYKTTETSGMQMTDGYHGLVEPKDKPGYKEKVTTYNSGTIYNGPTSYTSTLSHKGSKRGKEYGNVEKGYADISYGPTHSSEYVYDAQLLKATKGYVRRIGDIPLKDDKTVEEGTYNLKHLKSGDIHSTWYEATPIKYGLIKESDSGYGITETGYKTGSNYGVTNGGKYVIESSGYKTSKNQPPKGYGTGYISETSKKYTTNAVYGPSGSSYIPLLDNTEATYIPPTGPGYVPIYSETSYSLNGYNSHDKKKKTDIKTTKGYATDYSGSADYGSGNSYNVVSGYATTTKHDSQQIKKGYSGYDITGSGYVSGTIATEGQVSGRNDLESYPSATGGAYPVDQQYTSKNKKEHLSSYGAETATSYGTNVLNSGYGTDATYDSPTFKGKSTSYRKGSDSTYVSGSGYGVIDSGYGSSKKVIKKTKTKYVSGKYASGYGLDGSDYNAIEGGYGSGYKTDSKKDGIYVDNSGSTYGIEGSYATAGSGYEPSTGYESSKGYYGDYVGKGSYVSENSYGGHGSITSSTYPPSFKGNSSYGTSGTSTYSSESTYGSGGSDYPSTPGYAGLSYGAVVSKKPQAEYGVATHGYETDMDLMAESGTVQHVTPSCTTWATPAKTLVLESSPGAGKCGCKNSILDEEHTDGKESIGQRYRRRGYMCLPLKKLLPVMEGA